MNTGHDIFFSCSHFEKYGEIIDLYMPKVSSDSCANDHTLIHAVLCTKNYIYLIVPLIRNVIFLSIIVLYRIIARKHIVELGSSHMQVQVRLLTCPAIIFSCNIQIGFCT